MNESDIARLDPHKNGLFAGCLLGGASVFFALIAIGIMLSGNTSFEVVEFGLGIESRYLRALLLPFFMFIGGYAFAFLICSAIRFLLRHHTE